MEEIWKDILGYEGLYKISNTGKVINCKTNKQMAVSANNIGGYYRIGLTKDRKRKQFSLHRLIAIAFIPNPENKPCIDHINTIRTDNRVENLKWCTRHENQMNPITRKNLRRDFTETHRKKISESLKGKPHSKEHNEKVSLAMSKRPIICVETGEIYKSTLDIQRKIGLWHQNIVKVLQGKLKTCGGFHWEVLL